MWTDLTHSQYERSSLRIASGLMNGERKVIALHLTARHRLGRHHVLRLPADGVEKVPLHYALDRDSVIQALTITETGDDGAIGTGPGAIVL